MQSTLHLAFQCRSFSDSFAVSFHLIPSNHLSPLQASLSFSSLLLVFLDSLNIKITFFMLFEL